MQTSLAVIAAFLAATGGGAGSGAIVPDNPHTSRVALHLDATGQSDGTGYTTEDSRHNHALTWNGGASISSERFTFDGTGWIELADSLLWTPGSKFTIVIPDITLNTVSGIQTLIGHYDASPGRVGFHLVINSGEIEFGWSTTGAATTNLIETGEVVSTGSIGDLAVCWDGAYVFVLLDGIQIGELAFTGLVYNAITALRIGARGETETDFLDGSFPQLLYTKGECLYTRGADHTTPALTVDTSATADPFYEDVIAYIEHDEELGRWRDFGPLDLRVDSRGTVAVSSSIEPFAECGSIEFSGGKLYIVDDPLLEIGSGDYTVESFVRHKSLGTAGQTYIGKYDATTSDRSWVEQFAGYLSPDILRFVRSNNGSGTTGIVDSAAYTPSTSSFFHTATSGSGTAHRKFIDGVQSGATQTTAVALRNTAAPLGFGGVGLTNSTVDPFDGYQAGMRVTRAQRYTGTFTVPTSRYATV